MKNRMQQNEEREYFYLLLPSLPEGLLQKTEHPFFKALSPHVRYPFHVTLYFLGKLSQTDLASAIDWLNEQSRVQSAIKAKVNSISFFSRSDGGFVYYLDISSAEINALNSELYKRFSHIRKDAFEFKAHMTLFYSTKKISETQMRDLHVLFSDVTEINFHKMALGSTFSDQMKTDYLVDLI